MTIAAAGGLVWKSLAMTCRSGSMTRASAWTMNAAMPSTSSDARSGAAAGTPSAWDREAGMTNHPMRRECTVTNPTPITPTWQTVFDFLDKYSKAPSAAGK